MMETPPKQPANPGAGDVFANSPNGRPSSRNSRVLKCSTVESQIFIRARECDIHYCRAAHHAMHNRAYPIFDVNKIAQARFPVSRLPGVVCCRFGVWRFGSLVRARATCLSNSPRPVARGGNFQEGCQFRTFQTEHQSNLQIWGCGALVSFSLAGATEI